MNLNDEHWKELKGGYQTAYDTSIELRKLENATDQNGIEEILDTLWNELHHQGDVGSASYHAVPHLVRIAMLKELFDWRIIGLILTIEHQRMNGSNPEIPEELKEEYFNSIKQLGKYAQDKIDSRLDDTTYIAAISAIVTASGRIDLAKAIVELEDKDILMEFLDQF